MKEQLNLDGTLVSYYRFGEGKTNLVFLHGWRSNGLVWKNITDNMDLRKYSIYLLDLPGFGDSPNPKKTFTILDYSNTVFKFIQKLELKSITIVGHSFGGRVTIKLSALHPELIEKIILVDSAGVRLTGSNKYKSVAKIAKPFFKPKFMQGIRKKIYQTIGAEDYVETPELKETFVNIISEDLTRFMPRIIQPTLIIWGAEDTETPLLYAEIMNQAIKGSRLEIFESAGHFSFLDQPELFARELNSFLNESA
jgi:pimeloyl-ACP methyl ester carboxylesterase